MSLKKLDSTTTRESHSQKEYIGDVSMEGGMNEKNYQESSGLLTSKLRVRLQSLRPWPTECCIYKVPVTLRSINESAYTPRVVSIGPLHHGATNLQQMEVHKYMYLNLLLDRNSKITLEGLIQVVKVLEERARNCYQNEFTRDLTSDQFVDMMLLDSCFILTLFLLSTEQYAKDDHDPMFDSNHLLNNVEKDLMLLENQVPLFILEQLFQFISPSTHLHTFSYLVVMWFSDKIQEDQWHRLISLDNHQVKHFVDLILKGILPSEVCQTPTNNVRKPIELPSATELQKSGITFRKGVSNCFLDLMFTNGVLEIPFLCVDGRTELLFRNLIAMEQCHVSSTSYITDYTMLMDFLINTPNDVALLRSCGIINNYLGSDEGVCQVFNNIHKAVYRNREDSQYYGILEEVSSYYNRRWNLWKAHLKRDYFQNPWTIISLNAALILLICTLIQAVCSVISMT